MVLGSSGVLHAKYCLDAALLDTECHSGVVNPCRPKLLPGVSRWVNVACIPLGWDDKYRSRVACRCF
jgi:hypothetical protein